MILAIGYRVCSHRGTQFRQWATARLNEYLVKGFTMNDDRLKEMRNFGEDYFDELDEYTSFSSYHGLALFKEGLLIDLFHPYVYAFDLEGNEVWKSEYLNHFGEITVDSEGTSYFAGISTLIALDTEGNIKWEMELLFGYGGVVMIGSNEEIYLAMDAYEQD